MNDLHHPLDLLGCDWSGTALLSQQIHHVSGELVAGLQKEWREKGVVCESLKTAVVNAPLELMISMKSDKNALHQQYKVLLKHKKNAISQIYIIKGSVKVYIYLGDASGMH